MNATSDQMAVLAASIESEVADSTVELTDFPSGGAMLDVRRSGRLFVMSYAPAHGFGVDEVRPDDGFVTGYQYAFSEFAPAADQLRQLVSDQSAECPVCPDVILSLVVVYSRDLEATTDFYRCLGITFKQEKHGSGPEHYAAELGSAVFEIYPCRGQPPQADVRLGFRVKSLDGVLAQLRRHNVKVHSKPQASPWGLRAVVEDPDGNKVELLESKLHARS